jgi:metal-responsive CopG/Arc/MetJ family transcriptional regulator
MDLTKYPLWLLRSRGNEDKKYIGAMLPSSLFEELEKFAYKEKLTYSDVIRLAVWEFLQKESEGSIKDKIDLGRN